MEVRSVAKSVRISPRKIRLIADSIREKSITEAYMALTAANKRASIAVEKALKSAVANATHNKSANMKDLHIKEILVTEGQVFKRFRPSTRGRIHSYKKRSSNLTIVVADKAGREINGPKS